MTHGTRVARCECSSTYQDLTYGKQNRLQNKTIKGYRCTVCAKEFTVATASTAAAASK